jgi:hypothetical protein
VLEQLTDISLDMQQPERAGCLWGAALRLREKIGIAVQPRQKNEIMQRENRLEAILGTAVRSRIVEGKAMSLKNVLDYVMTDMSHEQIV